MKKLVPFLALAVTSISLVGCGGSNNTKTKLTYGRLFLDETITLNDITFQDFQQKMMNEVDEDGKAIKGHHLDENFIIATYDEGSTCGCWNNHLKPTLLGLMEKYHYEIYTIANQKIPENDYGLKHYLNQSMPTIAIVNHGKFVKQYVYDVNAAMFSKVEALKTELDEYVEAPQLMKVSEKYLDNILFSNPVDSATVYYMREKCPDCQAVSPAVVWPYSYENTLKENMYVFDLDPIRDACVAKDDMKEYNKFKNDHFLCSKYVENYGEESAIEHDNPLGYGDGVVPTFSHYEKGVLKDASVYLNDSVNKNEQGKYIVSNSYYTQERSQILKYLDKAETKVLQGMELSEEDISCMTFTKDGVQYEYCSWLTASARKYHDPLLKAFLDKYMK